MNLSYYETREQMCKIAKTMWDRRLTNAAGGNFAVRVDENRILISPSMMSEHHQCDMQPEDLMLIDYDENVLEGTGKLSRETKMHVLILSGFKNISATICNPICINFKVYILRVCVFDDHIICSFIF